MGHFMMRIPTHVVFRIVMSCNHTIQNNQAPACYGDDSGNSFSFQHGFVPEHGSSMVSVEKERTVLRNNRIENTHVDIL
jgi:hypothetical protein